MSTFSITSKEEAEIFSHMLSLYWKSNNAGVGGDENFLPALYEMCSPLDLGGRIFNSVIDLELTYLFMAKDTMRAGGIWNQSFSRGKLEGGSVLDHYQKFQGKMNILEGFTSFTYRCRAFWDKYMGLLVLIHSPEDYEKYCRAKSRKKKFTSLSAEWNDFPNEIQNSLIHTLQGTALHDEINNKNIFPNPFIDIFYTLIEQLDNHYRTAEAHGTGSIRKWSLSMLPIEESKDFGLINHWNFANSMIQGLRKSFFQGEFSHNKSMQLTANVSADCGIR